jgi:hypothetical protein
MCIKRYKDAKKYKEQLREERKKNPPSKQNFIIQIVLFSLFLLMGIGVIWLSIVNYEMADNFEKNGVPTTAVVIEIKEDYSNSDSVNLIIYVEYEVNGETLIKPLSYNTTNYGYDDFIVGKTIPIRYLKDNPGRACYDKDLFAQFRVWFIVGAVIVTIGWSGLFYMLVIYRKKLKATKNPQPVSLPENNDESGADKENAD